MAELPPTTEATEPPQSTNPSGPALPAAIAGIAAGYGPVDEWDYPLGGLSAMARVRLDRTYLEAALAEVRFVSAATALTETAAAAVWEALGAADYPVFEPSVQQVVNINFTDQGAVPVTQQQHGWVLATADRMTAVTLMPALVTVQTRRYERYSVSIGDPLRKVLEAFSEVMGAARTQRIGLRYLNRLTDPAADAPKFWAEHVQAPFVGPLTGPLSHLATGLHQDTQLQLGPTSGARVQTGVFIEQGTPAPSGHAAAGAQRYSYLIDLDVFREQAAPYDPVECANHLRQLNRTALALFAQVLSRQYLAELNPTPTDPATPTFTPTTQPNAGSTAEPAGSGSGDAPTATSTENGGLPQ